MSNKLEKHLYIFRCSYGMGDFLICFEAICPDDVILVYPDLEYMQDWPKHWSKKDIERIKRKFTFKLNNDNPKTLSDLLKNVKPD